MECVEWRDIPEYCGIYQVSNTGYVRRIKGGPGAQVGKVLKSALHNGYLVLILHKEGVPKNHSVHRLVALAFLDNPDPTKYLEVNHRNGNRADSHLSNLEWVTPQENQRHSWDILGRLPTRPTAKITESDVREIRKLLTTTDISQKDIAIKFGISSDTVSSIKVGRTWKHVTLENSQITQNNDTLVRDTQTEDVLT